MTDEALARLPPLSEVIRRHRLGARKSLGQHFLLDLNLTAKIVRLAGDLAGKTVLEIGPGPGGLTRALLAAGAARVVAVERDRRCQAALADLVVASGGRLLVIDADALKLDETAVLDGPAVVVSNLPYNIATRLLVKWLDRLQLFERLTLMFQKEVADRLTAKPRSKAYGRLSVVVQWRMATRALFDLPPRAFTPPPKVTSALVGFEPRAEPLAPADPKCLERVVAAAFGQRRKMLRSSLKGLVADPSPVLRAAGLAPESRAEELDVTDYCRLARAFEAAT